jgi:hypothetical protein
MSDKIAVSPEFESRHAFDAEHNTEPCRMIAKRIVLKHDISPLHPIVDDISHAIEDALTLGEKRGRALTKAGF